jgi:hypothetical protein
MVVVISIVHPGRLFWNTPDKLAVGVVASSKTQSRRVLEDPSILQRHNSTSPSRKTANSRARAKNISPVTTTQRNHLLSTPSAPLIIPASIGHSAWGGLEIRGEICEPPPCRVFTDREARR